jgi:hypothetical protein
LVWQFKVSYTILASLHHFAEVWDGEMSKLTFRRIISERLKKLWFELQEIVGDVVLEEDEDQIIYRVIVPNGEYSLQSLYVVNPRGVTPVFVHAVWKLHIPPRIHIFLWLLSKNRILTEDNLAKRREVLDQSCLLCVERESVDHLSFNVLLLNVCGTLFCRC